MRHRTAVGPALLPGLLLANWLLAGCHPRTLTGATRTEHRDVELAPSSELTRVELRMSAGEMRVSGGAAKLMEAAFTYNVDSWKPVIEYRSTGSRGDLMIRQPEGVHVGAGQAEYTWDVRLNHSVQMDLAVNLGAGKAEFNLGSLNLRSVQVDMGVGEVTMDLRGMPQRSYDVRINGGVGEARIDLPSNVGIVATASGGIGAINVKGLDERNGRWIRRGQENNPVQVRLDVKGGVGEIDIYAD